MQVSYSEYLGKYVMVFNVNVWKEYVEEGRRLTSIRTIWEYRRKQSHSSTLRVVDRSYTRIYFQR